MRICSKFGHIRRDFASHGGVRPAISKAAAQESTAFTAEKYRDKKYRGQTTFRDFAGAVDWLRIWRRLDDVSGCCVDGRHRA
jgi:hypothetical protein